MCFATRFVHARKRALSNFAQQAVTSGVCRPQIPFLASSPLCRRDGFVGLRFRFAAAGKVAPEEKIPFLGLDFHQGMTLLRGFGVCFGFGFGRVVPTDFIFLVGVVGVVEVVGIVGIRGVVGVVGVRVGGGTVGTGGRRGGSKAVG